MRLSRRTVLKGALASSAIGFEIMLHSTDHLEALGGDIAGSRVERILRSPNFAGGLFHDGMQTPAMLPGRFFDAARDWAASKDTRPRRPLPTVCLLRESFAAPATDDVAVCWIGHSTVLLELDGLRLLLDPTWGHRSSPSRLFGPARFQPPPLPLDDLPELSAVVISHDHYDHLDKGTIQFLARRDRRVPFLVPLGVGAHLEAWGVPADRIVELDWWEETALGGGRVRLVAAPARHFSGRGVFDRNKTLWASWAVIGRSHRVYFGGDGGYHGGFAEIAGRLGPFDLTILEIGAWHPSWSLIHLGPENALRAHRDLAGRLLLPVHWGTFKLAPHAWAEPIDTLVARATGSRTDLLVPKPGEIVRLRAAPGLEEWWRV